MSRVYPLHGNQVEAADPNTNVWLSASAGTGKTQVLSARVLRLLLTPGVSPSQVLCLTFTKAGAAEMANRINEVLARWVRLDDTRLGTELAYLGADVGPDTRAHARTLFASVLDCPGGGLRIDTIHAFSQWLLSKFPEEAGLTPGSRPMDDRDRELLAREVLADMLAEGERGEGNAFVEAVSRYACAKNPEALRGWLMRCAGASALWHGPGSWQPPMIERVRRVLVMPSDADEAWADELLDRDNFPDDVLRQILPVMHDWKGKTGDAAAELIEEWLGLDIAARKEAVGRFNSTILKTDGTPRVMNKPSEAEPRLPKWQVAIAEALREYDDRQARLGIADFLANALEMGRAFALRWEEAKTREGLLDFDDLIRLAARLLEDEDSQWIRYKLDRDIDHVLIDEAQDTNKDQWDIIFALIDDFFDGEGARGDVLRTIFTVGDYKQAIFGFQGTSPKNFEAAKQRVAERIRAAKANAIETRHNRRLPGWADLDLGKSFRTSKPVLQFVDSAIAQIGPGSFGLPRPPEPHDGDARAGLVALWQPVVPQEDDEEDPDESDGHRGSRTDAEGTGDVDDNRDWLPRHETKLAAKLAEQVRRWVSLEEPYVLEKGERRHAGAGDIMILVRRRTTLAREIVAKLHASGVPVAGVDRLRLGSPLAVKDLMAALRFAAQPLDDLNLANLLASPLIGWSQDDLLAHVPRPAGRRLWQHLRASDDPLVVDTLEKIAGLLARADYDTPQALIAWMLSGPWQARRALIARLGREANDAIDELVNAAFAYESAHMPSLAGFIAWFDAGTSELKRDPDEGGGQVRVMTVHGSKGLQAPIVILADAASSPSREDKLELVDDPLGTGGDADLAKIPLPGLSKKEQRGPIVEAKERATAAQMEEHWRLLYVAMTRAEEALFIGGSLGKSKADKGPGEDSWYARLAPLFEGPEMDDPLFGTRREWGARAEPLTTREAASGERVPTVLPDWALSPIGDEPRPPRPLAPSNAGEDLGADPPVASDAASDAARRGVLIHRLLERLPELGPEARAQAARSWLESQASDLAAEAREEIVDSALKVLDEPDFAAIFSPEALAEVPLAAVVDGLVVAGTADRLLVTDREVQVVDFKTARRPPTALDEIPRSVMRQMAAYAAALETIYPGREVSAAVLYTQTPQLFAIPPAMLAGHKRELDRAQQSYAPRALE
ncbi:double-strand break repair helicase AddA [Qipengyuania nanhaisediminis]|uniref:double-strand break repair helicase AddA n=1 Tax=Qipengyuania nanhaisediminis TaxID=604088 RepID=UPI0038B2C111